VLACLLPLLRRRIHRHNKDQLLLGIGFDFYLCIWFQLVWFYMIWFDLIWFSLIWFVLFWLFVYSLGTLIHTQNCRSKRFTRRKRICLQWAAPKAFLRNWKKISSSLALYDFTFCVWPLLSFVCCLFVCCLCVCCVVYVYSCLRWQQKKKNCWRVWRS
jgi:hypothetical protein